MKKSIKPADRVILTAEVERLSAELAQAQADVALLQRLKDAQANASRLADELAAAQDALANRLADDAGAERDARYKQFGAISVTVIPDAKRSPNALSASYSIRYDRVTYDHALKRSVMATHETLGFAGLAPDVMDYLVNAKPDAIPAIIMDLAPGDPAGALGAYFVAMRRGYLSGPVAA